MLNSNICDCCDTKIYGNCTVYKGLDCTFCSPICRIRKMPEIIKNKELKTTHNSSSYVIQRSRQMKRQSSYSNIILPKQITIPDELLSSNNAVDHKINITTVDNLDNKFTKYDNSNAIYTTILNYLSFISSMCLTICIYNILFMRDKFTYP